MVHAPKRPSPALLQLACDHHRDFDGAPGRLHQIDTTVQNLFESSPPRPDCIKAVAKLISIQSESSASQFFLHHGLVG
jgi:hypothetical protein